MSIPGWFRSGQVLVEAERLREAIIVNGITYHPGDWRLLLKTGRKEYERDEAFRQKWEPEDVIARDMWQAHIE